MDGEVWQSVIGYEGVYEVSDHGRIRRIAPGPRTRPGRILKLGIGRSGYLEVSLYLHGKRTTHRVSILVADAFLPAKCPTDRVVRHLNDNPFDNRAVNLARGTLSDNAQDAIRNGVFHPPRGSAHGRAKLTEDNVREIRQLYATGNYSQLELGLRFGVSKHTISLIVRRKIWKHVV